MPLFTFSMQSGYNIVTADTLYSKYATKCRGQRKNWKRILLTRCLCIFQNVHENNERTISIASESECKLLMGQMKER